jgi:hypothetical protein
VGTSQTVSGALLVAALLALSAFYAWRQVRLLRRLPAAGLAPDEARWRRRQAWRRLVGCGLMLALAALLSVALLFLEAQAQELADQGRQAEATPEHRHFLYVYGAVWIAILLLLLAVVALAGLDLWSTRRFIVQQYRRLQDERRAAIQEEIDRRRGRNGPAR